MTTDRDKKVILVVIDGLTPSMFEAAVGDGRFPALSFLAEQGRYSRAVSTFPLRVGRADHVAPSTRHPVVTMCTQVSIQFPAPASVRR